MRDRFESKDRESHAALVGEARGMIGVLKVLKACDKAQLRRLASKLDVAQRSPRSRRRRADGREFSCR